MPEMLGHFSSVGAVSSTLLVNCFNSASGPVNDKPSLRVTRTSSLAASSSAEGSGLFFLRHSL